MIHSFNGLNSHIRVPDANPAVSGNVAVSKMIVGAFLNSLACVLQRAWNSDFSLRVFLLDNSCGNSLSGVLIEDLGIEGIDAVWGDVTEVLSSWHLFL